MVSTGTQLVYLSPGSVDIFDGYNIPGELNDPSLADGNESDIYYKRTCDEKTFDDILLVIAFVETCYDSIPNLERLYRKHFPNILYCGPAKPQNENGYNIVVVPMLHGVLVYECLSEAIREHSDFQGFLFVRNDVFINFWSLARFDKSRIWENSGQLGSQVMFHQPRDSWIWWYTPWGLKACEKAYRDLIYFNDVYRRALIDNRDQKEGYWDVEASLNALLWNGRGLYRCYRGRSNVFHVPSRYATVFEKMSAIFQKHQVFMDIAVPTMIRMLDLTERIEQLTGVDVGDFYGEEKARMDDTLFWRHFVPNTSFIRPIILLYQNNTKSKIDSFIGNLISRLNDIRCFKSSYS